MLSLMKSIENTNLGYVTKHELQSIKDKLTLLRIDVNKHERLFNITRGHILKQRNSFVSCCSSFQNHSRVFNNPFFYIYGCCK